MASLLGRMLPRRRLLTRLFIALLVAAGAIKTVREYDILPHVIEPNRHNQNRVEGFIREIRQKWYRVILKKKVPRRKCDYGLRWVGEIMQCIVSWSGSLEGRTSFEMVTGETPDISEYLDFGF